MKYHIFKTTKKTIYNFIGLVMLLIITVPLSSQNMVYRGNSTVNLTPTSPVKTILDNGGNSNYQPNSCDTMTIFPPTGQVGYGVRLTWLDRKIGRGDTLFFYNGPTASPENLVSFATARKVGVCDESVVYGMSATMPNETGAMTLRFVSNGDTLRFPVTVKNNLEESEIQDLTLQIYDVQMPYTYGDSVFNYTYVGNDSIVLPKTVWFSCDSAVRVNLVLIPTPSGTTYDEQTICFSELNLPDGWLYEDTDTIFYGADTKLITMPDGSSRVMRLNVINAADLQGELYGETTNCYGLNNMIETTISTDMVASAYRWFLPDGSLRQTSENHLSLKYTPANILTQANGRYGVIGIIPCGESDTIWQHLSFFFCQDSIPEGCIRGEHELCIGQEQAIYEVKGGEGHTFAWYGITDNGGTIIGPTNTNIIVVNWTIPGEKVVKARLLNDQSAGFKLQARYDTICQPFNALITQATELISGAVHVPTYDTPSDGYKYINLCPKSPYASETSKIRFQATGEYLHSGSFYNQSDAQSSFHWIVGVDTPTSDSTTTYTNDNEFRCGYGYDITLRMTDQQGCNSNPTNLRVRTSRNLNKSFTLPQYMCVDSSYIIRISDSIGGGWSQILIDTVQLGQETSKVTTEKIFLPDGDPCPPMGCGYQSIATFTAYPGVCITSVEDILFLRINMEHSYMGDIFIQLVCPSGQKTNIMKWSGNGSTPCASQILPEQRGWIAGNNVSTGVFFGLAYDSEGYPKCDSSQPNNRSGIGWNYCWSQTTNQGYRYGSNNSYIPNRNNHLIYRSGNAHSQTFPSGYPSFTHDVIDSTNLEAMTHFYMPDGDFADLIGCPINGDWYVEVIDAWGIDNGYLFEWELALDPSLKPDMWGYSVDVDTVIVSQINNGAPLIPVVEVGKTYEYIRPNQATTTIGAQFNYQYTDSYGCTYNGIPSSMVFVSDPPTITGLESNVVACYGETISLNAETEEPSSFLWSTGSSTQNAVHNAINVMSSGNYWVRVRNNRTTCANSDTIQVTITPPPDPELSTRIDECKIKLDIHPENCNTTFVSGYQIFRDSIRIEENFVHHNSAMDTTYTDEAITDEEEHLYWVISRFDDVHIPELFDICLTDGTYYPYTSLPLPAGKTATGIVYHITDSNYWIVALRNYAPVPALQRVWGKMNDYLGFGNYTEATAHLDLSGKANTDSIISLSSITTAANSCRNFNAVLGFDEKWYLPSFGQMIKIHNNLTTLNSILSQLNGVQITEEELWTSTEKNANAAFAFNGTEDPVSLLKDEKRNARPVATMPFVTKFSDTIAITASISKPIARINGINIIDLGESAELSAGDDKVYPTGYAPVYSYVWRDPSGSIVGTGATYATPIYTVAGTYHHTLIITLDNGCSDTAEIDVIVAPMPALEGDFIVCQGETRTYTTDVGPDINGYVWTANTGTIIGADTNSSVEIQWNVSGTQTVGVEYLSNGVPSNIRYRDVTVIETPDSLRNVSGGGKYCSGGNGRIIQVENPQINMYYKLFRDGIATTVPAVAAVNENPISFGLQTLEGIYTVKVYTTNPDNNYNEDTCEAQLHNEVMIVITPNPPARQIHPE